MASRFMIVRGKGRRPGRVPATEINVVHGLMVPERYDLETGAYVVPGMALGSGSRTTDAVVRMLNNGGRKQIGNASSIGWAHPRAPQSEEKIRIRPYMVPAREGIQAPRVTAYGFARLTNSTSSPRLFPATNITIHALGFEIFISSQTKRGSDGCVVSRMLAAGYVSPFCRKPMRNMEA